MSKFCNIISLILYLVHQNKIVGPKCKVNPSTKMQQRNKVLDFELLKLPSIGPEEHGGNLVQNTGRKQMIDP